MLSFFFSSHLRVLYFFFTPLIHLTLSAVYLFNSSLWHDNKYQRQLQVFSPITCDIICSIIVHWNNILSRIPSAPRQAGRDSFFFLFLSFCACVPDSWEIKKQRQRVANHDQEDERGEKKRQKRKIKTRTHQKNSQHRWNDWHRDQRVQINH